MSTKLEALALIHDDASSWMKAAAREAILAGHFKVIPNRKRTGPYLLRCWLTTPTRSIKDGYAGWESGNSLLLHRFFAPDDDNALHDHPWDFRTRILQGGYIEYAPPFIWDPRSVLGPPYGGYMARVDVGTTIDHEATDLHAVGKLLRGDPTWTLVETGPRVRDWGFFPPGKPRVPAMTFLGRKGPQLMPGVAEGLKS